MLTENEINLYEEERMFWVEGAQIINASPKRAWEALTQVATRSSEISTLDHAEESATSDEDLSSSLITQGNRTVINAKLLNGWIKMQIMIVISQVQQGKYCRMEITTLKQHFADIDYLIEPKGDSQCLIRYRQGYHYRTTFLGWVSKHLTLKQREIPETVEIFNLWKKHIED